MLNRNLLQNLNDLKSGCLSSKAFNKHQHVTADLIKRLKLDDELKGHEGCVNCLEWNETGEFLASGSDDVHVMIWDAFNYRRVADINTFHKGNIFSVKFMPKFNNTKLASGAADSCVKVIDISQETTIENYSCHETRVKRLAISQNDPYLFWSCSEDGTVRQFDIRQSANSQNTSQAGNVLINLNSHIGSNAEVKCLAVNPVRSDQLAIGSNDHYVRLYDRRKLSLRSYQNSDRKNRNSIKRFSNGTVHAPINGDLKSISPDAVQYFAPSHIPWNQSENKYTQFSCTYLTFSPDGNSLLVNMGSEQVYLYDVNKTRPSFSFRTTLAKRVATCNCELLCDYSNIRKNSFPLVPVNIVSNLCESDKDMNDEMPAHLNILKDKGNKMYKTSDYHSAIMHYNLAIQQGGHVYSRFYANRAAAYMSRNWTGDIYAALMDSIRALEIDYCHIKSHFRIAQCLFQLNMIAESSDYIKYLQFLFPNESKKIKQIEELERKVTDKIQDIIYKETKEKTRETATNGSKVTGATSSPISMNIIDIIAKNTNPQTFNESKSFCDQELSWRKQANDYVKRFCGHCNTTTDIKEANFFGIDGQFIMAGSDEGNIFFWDRNTENIIRVVCGDSHIVNCLQPHPTVCFLASSGIDHVIRLWSPGYSNNVEKTDDENSKIGMEQNEIKAAKSNQTRINNDPIEYMLMSLGYPSTIFPHNSDDNEDEEIEGGSSENNRDENETGRDPSNSTGRSRQRRRCIRLENAENCRTS